MAQGVRGDVVTFLITGSATTQAGIVIGVPSTTTNVVAYDFAVPHGGRAVHCKEYTTTSVTVVSNLTD